MGLQSALGDKKQKNNPAVTNERYGSPGRSLPIFTYLLHSNLVRGIIVHLSKRYAGRGEKDRRVPTM